MVVDLFLAWNGVGMFKAGIMINQRRPRNPISSGPPPMYRLGMGLSQYCRTGASSVCLALLD